MKNEVNFIQGDIRFTLATDVVTQVREKAFRLAQMLRLDNSLITKMIQLLNECSQPYIDSCTQYMDDIITYKLDNYIKIKKSCTKATFRQSVITRIIDFFIRSMQEIDPSILEKSPVFLKIQEHEILYEQSLPRKPNEQLSILPLHSLFSKQLSLQDRIKLLMLLVNEQARHQIEKIFVNHPVVQLVDRKYQVFDKLKEIKLFYLVLNDALCELVVDPIVKSLDYQRSAIAYYVQPVIERVKKSFIMYKLQFKLCKNQILFKAIQTRDFLVLSFQFKHKGIFNHFKKAMKVFIRQTFNVPIYTHKLYIYCGVLVESFAQNFMDLYMFIQQEFDKFIKYYKNSAVKMAEDLYSEALKVYRQKKYEIIFNYNLIQE